MNLDAVMVGGIDSIKIGQNVQLKQEGNYLEVCDPTSTQEPFAVFYAHITNAEYTNTGKVLINHSTPGSDSGQLIFSIPDGKEGKASKFVKKLLIECKKERESANGEEGRIGNATPRKGTVRKIEKIILGFAFSLLAFTFILFFVSQYLDPGPQKVVSWSKEENYLFAVDAPLDGKVVEAGYFHFYAEKRESDRPRIGWKVYISENLYSSADELQELEMVFAIGSVETYTDRTIYIPAERYVYIIFRGVDPRGLGAISVDRMPDSWVPRDEDRAHEFAEEFVPQEVDSESNTDKETMGQKNAVGSAQSYLEYSSFSRFGLIKQLEFEGYSPGDAVYAVDKLGVDWDEQAAKKAQAYLDYSNFSRSELIDQLKFEGFTQDQAEYGVNAVGY